MSRLLARPAVGLLAALVLAGGCRTLAPRGLTPDLVLQQAAAAQRYDPSRDLGLLFADVQMSRVFPDSKTFVDATPLEAPTAIVARYDAERGTPGFDLGAFVRRHFAVPQPAGVDPSTSAGQAVRDTSLTMEQHIRALWPVLTRKADSADTRSSLIPLPNEYVVPGGRFREVYYWDSYFTMLGLVQSGRTDLVRSMLDNFAYLIRTVGHIPNGNRTYYLTRSQPPYFAAMVGLYAEATDTTQALRWLDAMEAEYGFWMSGADRLKPGQAVRRVAMTAEGFLLNRYWDDRDDPRPESFREDFTLGQTVPDSLRSEFYRNVRATAESGWDFSNRWMRDPKDLRTLETTELLPVDLNSLLYNEERTIAALRAFRGKPGDAEVARRFEKAAADRKRALLALSWDVGDGMFFDVRWRTGLRVPRPTLAAAAPLYFGVAEPWQARLVATQLDRLFLRPGGFVTSLVPTGQQWDAPNGWAPLEWLTIEGIRRYGGTAIADSARERWLTLNRRVYRATGKMTEKYDVVDTTRAAGGGEYPTQDGFGWTNGVALALSAQERAERRPPPRTPDRGARERQRH